MAIYYQFLSNSNAITNLERGMIKISTIKKVNDLFELKPYLRIERNKRKQIVNIRNVVTENYGMACFSKDWQEPIMWGHYAESCKGIVLGFEIDADNTGLKPVIYPAQRRRIDIPA